MKPPDPLVFFADRSLGKYAVPEALRQAGADVRVLDDLFPASTPDEIWLAHAGRHGWIVLTKDDNIRSHRVTLEALLRNHVRAFVLTPRNLTGEEMASAFIRALSRMSRLARNYPPPFIARVTRTGVVSILRLKQ